MKTRFYHIVLLSLLAVFIISCNKEEENNEPDPYIYNLVDKVNSDSLKSYVQWLQNMQTRFMFAKNRKTVALKIQKKFNDLGITNNVIDSFFVSRSFNNIPYQAWQYNVVATINGSITPNEYFIAGAHYDCYSSNTDFLTYAPGANDNASGVAALFEIARIVSSNSIAPKSSIQFVAFAAEELGLYGSLDFARKSAESAKDIGLMLNFDMIAHSPSNNPTDWVVNILDYVNSTSLRIEAQNYCSKYSLLNTINDNLNNTRSDSYSFYRYGYKALFFISAADDNTYHTSNDNVSNCNFEFSRKIVMAATAMIIEKNKI